MPRNPIRFSLRHTTATLLAAACLATPATAQPLADQVPEDALLYVGWAGGEALPAGYEGSLTQQLYEDAGLGEAIRQTFAAITAGMSEKIPEEEAAQVAGMVDAILPVVWGRPWALYLDDIDTAGGDPLPSGGLIIQAGAQRAELVELLGPIFEDLEAEGAPVAFLDADPYVAILIGDAAGSATLPVRGGQGLAGNTRFTDALAQATGETPASVAYLDAEGVVLWFEEMVKRDGGGDDLEMVRSVIDALGLRELETGVYATFFQDGRHASAGYVHAPGERQGLLALMEAEPIDEQAFIVVPETARLASAFRFDGQGLYTTLQAGLEQVDPGLAEEFLDLMDSFSVETQVDLESDLLASLGDEWVLYADEGMSLGVGPGYVLVNTPRDADKLEQTLLTLSQYATDMAAGMSPDVPMGVQTIEARGVAVHCVTLPVVSPAWAMHNDRLFIGLSAQAVVGAAQEADQAGSLLDNAAYQDARRRLPDTLSALSYANVPATGPDAYLFWTNLGQSVGTFAGYETASPMSTIYPTLAEVRGYFEAIVSGAWVDDDGLHIAAVEPFIGSSMLVWTPEDYVGQMVPSLAVGVLFPALGNARDAARQAQAAANARQLVMAGLLYAQENNDKFPADLEAYSQAAIDVEMGDASMWLSPYDGPVAMAEGLDAMDAGERAAWLEQHSGFVVLSGVTIDDGSEAVVLFGRPSKFNYDRVPVGFADGHVEIMPAWQADEVIRLQTNRTIYDWDESMMEGAADGLRHGEAIPIP